MIGWDHNIPCLRWWCSPPVSPPQPNEESGAYDPSCSRGHRSSAPASGDCGRLFWSFSQKRRAFVHITFSFRLSPFVGGKAVGLLRSFLRPVGGDSAAAVRQKRYRKTHEKIFSQRQQHSSHEMVLKHG